VRAAALLAVGLLPALLAGCTASDQAIAAAPTDPAVAAAVPPDGSIFAAVRHCTAVDFHAEAEVPGLEDDLPRGWSLASPGPARLRVVLWRCVDTMALLLTVAARAGTAVDATAPVVDYVLRIATNSTVDDWGALGPPVLSGTCTYESVGGDDVWTVTADASAPGIAPPLVVRLVVTPVGAYGGRQHDAVEQYAASDGPPRWAWTRETASVTREVEASVTFGPASGLEDAIVVERDPLPLPKEVHDLAGTAVVGSERWSAVNAVFRMGMAP
jgi:hypothetical protein